MKYLVKVRGQKGDFDRTIECDEIDFSHGWWAVFKRRKAAYVIDENEGTHYAGALYDVVAAVSSENLNLIELIEEK